MKRTNSETDISNPVITESNTAEEEALPVSTSSNSIAETKKPKLGKKVLTDQQVKILIEAVQSRPVLWAKYDIQNLKKRNTSWDESLEEVNTKGLELELGQLKSRWSSLRHKFQQCSRTLNKLVGHGATNDHELAWPFYDDMLFLNGDDADDDDEETLPSADSAVELPSADDEVELPFPDDFEDDLTHEYESYIHLEPQIEMLCGTPALVNSNINVSRSNMPATPPPSRSESTTSHPYRNFADSQFSRNDAIHSSTPRVPTLQGGVSGASFLQDPNSTFCKHILCELRELPDERSRRLRGILMQKMYNFMDTL